MHKKCTNNVDYEQCKLADFNNSKCYKNKNCPFVNEFLRLRKIRTEVQENGSSMRMDLSSRYILWTDSLDHQYREPKCPIKPLPIPNQQTDYHKHNQFATFIHSFIHQRTDLGSVVKMTAKTPNNVKRKDGRQL